MLIIRIHNFNYKDTQSIGYRQPNQPTVRLQKQHRTPRRTDTTCLIN